MWGGTSDHNRHPLLRSDGPTCMVMHPPLKPTSYYIRGWCSLEYRCMGQMYQPHTIQAHFQGKWRYDDATRVQWQGDHPMPCQQDFPGWINRKLWLLPWTSARVSTEDGWRHQVMCSRCRCQKEHVHLAEGMMSLPVDTIRWWTPWLTQLLMELGHSLQDQKGCVMGKYPSMSGGCTSWHLPPWCWVLLPNWRGTLTAGRKVALYPHYTEQDNDQNKRKTRTRW